MSKVDNVISLLPYTHVANRRRVSDIVIEALMLDPYEDDLGKIVRGPQGASNRDVIIYVTEGYFPTPRLAVVVDPHHIADLVIEEMSFQSGVPL